MNSNKIKKKETATLVYKKIGGAIADMTTGVKEKKVEKMLKKASEALADDITKAAKKAEAKAGKKSKAEKKAGGKKAKKKQNKAKKADKAGPPKMNNSPVATEAPPNVETVIP